MARAPLLAGRAAPSPHPRRLLPRASSSSTPPSPPAKPHGFSPAWAALIVVLLILVAAAVALLVYQRRSKRHMPVPEAEPPGIPPLGPGPHHFSGPLPRASHQPDGDADGDEKDPYERELRHALLGDTSEGLVMSRGGKADLSTDTFTCLPDLSSPAPRASPRPTSHSSTPSDERRSRARASARGGAAWEERVRAYAAKADVSHGAEGAVSMAGIGAPLSDASTSAPGSRPGSVPSSAALPPHSVGQSSLRPPPPVAKSRSERSLPPPPASQGMPASCSMTLPLQPSGREALLPASSSLPSGLGTPPSSRSAPSPLREVAYRDGDMRFTQIEPSEHVAASQVAPLSTWASTAGTPPRMAYAGTRPPAPSHVGTRATRTTTAPRPRTQPSRLAHSEPARYIHTPLRSPAPAPAPGISSAPRPAPAPSTPTTPTTPSTPSRPPSTGNILASGGRPASPRKPVPAPAPAPAPVPTPDPIPIPPPSVLPNPYPPSDISAPSYRGQSLVSVQPSMAISTRPPRPIRDARDGSRTRPSAPRIASPYC